MIRTLILVIIVAVVGAASSIAADRAPLPPVLEAIMAQPDHPLRTEDGRALVWVFFQERNPTQSSRDLAAARADLDPHTAARRARVRGADRIVLASDLPVNRRHLDAAQATGAVLRRTSRWLNAASFAATPAQIRRLADLPQVVRLAPVARFRRDVPEFEAVMPPAVDKAAAWTLDYGGSLAGLEQINVPPVHDMGLTGRDVRIGVLDTGFRTVHDALVPVDVVDAWDFVNDDAVVENEDGDPVSSRNHGTMVLSALAGHHAGDLVGVARGASVLLAKTEDVGDETPVEEDHWVAGLEWAEARGADIVTSSLVYEDWIDPSDLDGDTAVSTLAADAAVARGVVVVNAAGNSRSTTGRIGVPADGDSVITVGAVSSTGEVAYFSSPGPTYDGRVKPDVAALGLGTWVASPVNDHIYGGANGTSFAAPLVAGVAALILERAPQLTPIQVRTALRQSASQAATPDNDLGWGIVDALAAVTWFGPVYDHTPLADTEDTFNAITVTAGITARAGLDPSTLRLAYRSNGGSWQDTPLLAAPGLPDTWTADIPAQPAGTDVEYYLAGADLENTPVSEPVRAPARVHAFHVGPDTTPPLVADTLLGHTTLFAWPPVVRCTVTDNLGVAGVDLRYVRNGGAEQGPFPMTDLGDGIYQLVFPRDVAQVTEGDVYSYTLEARDTAAVPNLTVRGPRSFMVNSFTTRDTVMTVAGPVSIPDDGFQVGQSFLGVMAAQAGTVVGLQVDLAITHADVGQLTVDLESPQGTVVRLHDRGAAGTADLVGNWPETLSVSGPGDLGDFLAASNEGVWILTVTDHVTGDAGTIDSWGLRFTLTDTVSGGDVPTAHTHILGNQPNPFNPTTVIAFETRTAGRTRLSIHDVRGMLVRVLLDRRLSAGPHEATWNGRDGTGRQVASGVYLLRLSSAGDRDERKLTLIR
ncbi:MAG: S8 family serine peptidase [bacterium]|nr:S8 family serine peptidase [bacterium]